MDPNRIIELANKLKETKGLLKRLEQELRQAVSESEAEGPVEINPLGLATPTRIIMLLDAAPSQTFSFQEIYEQIGGNDNEPYIRSLLSRMTREGRIESRGWGKYGAVSQQKERPKVTKP